jgi:hypothetical protein
MPRPLFWRAIGPAHLETAGGDFHQFGQRLNFWGVGSAASACCGSGVAVGRGVLGVGGGGTGVAVGVTGRGVAAAVAPSRTLVGAGWLAAA